MQLTIKYNYVSLSLGHNDFGTLSRMEMHKYFVLTQKIAPNVSSPVKCHWHLNPMRIWTTTISPKSETGQKHLNHMQHSREVFPRVDNKFS